MLKIQNQNLHVKTCKKAFPLNRSLTGKGNIKTLKILKQINPDLKIYKFRSGKKFMTGKYLKFGM